jgi:opacity protein-like surface antigen
LADAFNDYSDIRTSGIGPLHGKIEYGVSEKVGVGLSVNFVSSTFKFNDNAAAYNYSTNRTSVKFNFRVNYHFSPSEKFDPYVGVGFGYGDSRWKTESNDPDYNFDYSNPIPIGFETTLGARLFVTPRIGFYAEAGVAKSFVQFGLCFNVGSTGGGGDFRF